MLNKTPTPWVQKYLSDSSVAQVIMGQSPNSSTFNNEKNGLPFYQGKTDFGRVSPTPRVWCSKPVKIAEADDILLSVRAPVGVVNMCTEKSCIGRGLCAIRAKETVLPKFLYYFFVFYEPILKTRGSGAVFDAITKTFVDKIKVPIPPTLAEQQEIVQVLDTMSDIIRLREECISHAQDLIPAIFQEMFGDVIKNKKNINKIKLGKIFILSSGKFLPAKEMDETGIYPVFGGNGINGYHNEYLFDEPKLCIGRVGVKCGCVHLTKPKSWITDNALYINKLLKPINIIYLKEALTQINLNQYAKRAAQPVISQSTIYNQYILEPPIELQEQFAQKAIEIEAYIKEQNEELENAKQMFQSLLHHAFTGELTRRAYGED